MTCHLDIGDSTDSAMAKSQAAWPSRHHGATERTGSVRKKGSMANGELL